MNFDLQSTESTLTQQAGVCTAALVKKEEHCLKGGTQRSRLNMIYSQHKQHFQSGVWMGERWHAFWTHMFGEDVRSSVEKSMGLASPPAVWLIVWYFYMWKTNTLLMCWACFALLWRWETEPCVELLTPRSPYGHPNGLKESFLGFLSSSFFFLLSSANAKLIFQWGVKRDQCWMVTKNWHDRTNWIFNRDNCFRWRVLCLVFFT